MSLLLAMAAILAGPVLLELGRRRPATQVFMDRFVFAATGCLLLFGILPEAVARFGPEALLLAVAGAALPWLAERFVRRGIRGMQAAMLILGAAGLILHSVIDGLALLTASGVLPHFHRNEALAAAIILHNLPAGMAIWLLLGRHFGRAAAAFAIVVLPVATAAGYLAGPAVLSFTSGRAAAAFQAFIVGSILHLLFHVREEWVRPANRNQAVAAAAGMVVGLLFVLPYL